MYYYGQNYGYPGYNSNYMYPQTQSSYISWLVIAIIIFDNLDNLNLNLFSINFSL